MIGESSERLINYEVKRSGFINTGRNNHRLFSRNLNFHWTNRKFIWNYVGLKKKNLHCKTQMFAPLAQPVQQL